MQPRAQNSLRKPFAIEDVGEMTADRADTGHEFDIFVDRQEDVAMDLDLVPEDGDKRRICLGGEQRQQSNSCPRGHAGRGRRRRDLYTGRFGRLSDAPCGYAAFKACVMSAIRSDGCSMPIDSRIVESRTPIF